MTDVFLCLSQSPGQDYFILDIFSSSDQIFLKKHLTNAPGYSIITKRFEEVATIQSFGRLAQLVEHLLDVQVVSGSIPLTSTRIGEQKRCTSREAPILGAFRGFRGQKTARFFRRCIWLILRLVRTRTPVASFLSLASPYFKKIQYPANQACG